MADFEELLGKVSGALYQQDIPILLKVAEKLNITGLEGLTRAKIIRRLRDQVEEGEEGVSVLRGLMNEFECKEPQVPHSAHLPNEPSASPNENEPPPSQVQAPPSQASSHLTVPPTYRKDLRISGQVGDTNQKESRSYSNLRHQIKAAVTKGYSEGEVVEAVLRAINPGLRLRSYLENYPDLTLDTLNTILKSHYQEKDATELYQELTNIAQRKTETAQSFVMRALDLRQRVIRASNESGEGLKYDEALVKNMFIHAVMTGLHNETGPQASLEQHYIRRGTSEAPQRCRQLGKQTAAESEVAKPCCRGHDWRHPSNKFQVPWQSPAKLCCENTHSRDRRAKGVSQGCAGEDLPGSTRTNALRPAKTTRM